MTAIELDLMVAAKVIRISDCTECELDIHDSNEVYVQAAAHWRDVAEKSQIQPLNQFQPVLPPSTPERHSPDYVRPGTTSLLAEFDVARGKVIGSLRHRRRAQEFKEFLVEIDTEVPADLDVHLILDNYATHKSPGDPPLAIASPALSPALNADLGLVAQHGGAVVRRHRH